MNPNDVRSDTKKKKGNYPFYAVIRGRVPGVYFSWPEAEEQVKGYPNAYFKGCHTLEEATQLCASATISTVPHREVVIRADTKEVREAEIGKNLSDCPLAELSVPDLKQFFKTVRVSVLSQRKTVYTIS